MRTHEQTVQSQFDPRAHEYLTSAVHSAGPDLQKARMLAARLPAEVRAVDIGCGAGHLSFALAPHLARIIALDPSPRMLEQVAITAAARGLGQIETREGSAESLPFEDGSLQLACTRYSAHHWTRLETAVLEMARVLDSAGHALIIDTLGQEDALVDTFMQSIELLRDPSHVRNRCPREWRSLFRTAGFLELEYAEWPTRLDFASWIDRMRTPAERAAVIRSLQAGSPRQVREALRIEADGSFTIRTGLFWLRKAA
jgi:ubiquinone/menaquinone biosynthesis C-methylase UbiE